MNRHPVLDQLASAGVRLGVEKIGSFLFELGEPHRVAPVVHVAGTNGKGSVCAFVTATLVAAGYRVGTTISPHLEQVNERILIDGHPVDDATLADAIEVVDRARWQWAAKFGLTGIPLTYFEFLIAAAFQVFSHRRVDVMVVEVGMGGRLDATNVVHPAVCAIPHIGLDHQAELGNTIAEIASEKAGILKRGVPAVLGALPQDARDVIDGIAQRLGVPLWKPGPHLRKEQRRDGRWAFSTPSGGLSDLELGLEGAHQGNNALVAFGVLMQLRGMGFHLPDAAFRTGFASAYIGGRLERLAPGLLVDGAHNPDGSRALAAYLQSRPKPGLRILLFGMGTGRDPKAVLGPLLPFVDEVVTTAGDHPNAWDPLELATALQELDVVLSAGGKVEEVLPEVFAEADETLVAGSLYLVGAVKALVRGGALAGIKGL